MSKNDDKFGDERLSKSAATSARGSRDNADVDRVHNDGGSLSAAQRRQKLRQDWVQEVLPTPPAIPGFHLCWLSTTNSTDPVHKRLQLGYQPVKITEVPGFDQYKVAEGQYEGCVACNEMLLFKIPLEVYQDIMTIYHHDIPLEQERSIRETVKAKVERDSSGKALVEDEGFNSLGQEPSLSPTFI